MAYHHDPELTFLFSKFDIKYGLCRMAINDEYAWDFCYAIPLDETCQLYWWHWNRGPQQPADGLVQKSSFLMLHHRNSSRCHRETNQYRISPASASIWIYYVKENTPTLHPTTTIHSICHAHWSVCRRLYWRHKQLHQWSPHPCIKVPLPWHTIHIYANRSHTPPLVRSNSQEKLSQSYGTWDPIKQFLGCIMDVTKYTIQLSPKQ